MTSNKNRTKIKSLFTDIQEGKWEEDIKATILVGLIKLIDELCPKSETDDKTGHEGDLESDHFKEVDSDTALKIFKSLCKNSEIHKFEEISIYELRNTLVNYFLPLDMRSSQKINKRYTKRVNPDTPITYDKYKETVANTISEKFHNMIFSAIKMCTYEYLERQILSDFKELGIEKTDITEGTENYCISSCTLLTLKMFTDSIRLALGETLKDSKITFSDILKKIKRPSYDYEITRKNIVNRKNVANQTTLINSVSTDKLTEEAFKVYEKLLLSTALKDILHKFQVSCSQKKNFVEIPDNVLTQIVEKVGDDIYDYTNFEIADLIYDESIDLGLFKHGLINYGQFTTLFYENFRSTICITAMLAYRAINGKPVNIEEFVDECNIMNFYNDNSSFDISLRKNMDNVMGLLYDGYDPQKKTEYERWDGSWVFKNTIYREKIRLGRDEIEEYKEKLRQDMVVPFLSESAFSFFKEEKHSRFVTDVIEKLNNETGDAIYDHSPEKMIDLVVNETVTVGLLNDGTDDRERFTRHLISQVSDQMGKVAAYAFSDIVRGPYDHELYTSDEKELVGCFRSDFYIRRASLKLYANSVMESIYRILSRYDKK